MSEQEAGRWLEFADEDLRAGDLLLAQGMLRPACFHAQQAVEKGLKGLLVARSGTHPKSHSLEQLLWMGSISPEERTAWGAPCRRLDGFYLPTRYADALPPGASGEPSREEAQHALADARNIVSQVRERMGGGR